jgi:hypothetical protein
MTDCRKGLQTGSLPVNFTSQQLYIESYTAWPWYLVIHTPIWVSWSFSISSTILGAFIKASMNSQQTVQNKFSFGSRKSRQHYSPYMNYNQESSSVVYTRRDDVNNNLFCYHWVAKQFTPSNQQTVLFCRWKSKQSSFWTSTFFPVFHTLYHTRRKGQNKKVWAYTAIVHRVQ